MTKLNIKKIENQIDKDIRKNTICTGWDVSERSTGICVLKSDDKDIEILLLDKIETSPRDDIKNRMDFYVMALEKFKQKLPEKKEWRINIIEQPFLGMNPFAYEALARFSTIVYLSFKKDVDYQVFMGANSARSKIGFNLNKEIERQGIKPDKISKGKNKGKDKKIDNKKVIAGFLKRVFNLEIEDHDQADAFVLALAGFTI
jgi:Holliday junction resolvasome RuvABC endonuclease subunit